MKQASGLGFETPLRRGEIPDGPATHANVNKRPFNQGKKLVTGWSGVHAPGRKEASSAGNGARRKCDAGSGHRRCV